MGIDLALSVVALLVAGVALWIGLGLRNQVAQIPAPGADPRADDLEGLKQATIDLRHDLDRALRELDELKAATEVLPAPPLPRTRPGGLRDLREQLRAAHREPDPASDE